MRAVSPGTLTARALCGPPGSGFRLGNGLARRRGFLLDEGLGRQVDFVHLRLVQPQNGAGIERLALSPESLRHFCVGLNPLLDPLAFALDVDFVGRFARSSFVFAKASIDDLFLEIHIGTGDRRADEQCTYQ